MPPSPLQGGIIASATGAISPMVRRRAASSCVDDPNLLHIFAATVWVGGQVVLAALVPVAPRRPAVGGMLAAGSLLSAVAALFLGVLLRSG